MTVADGCLLGLAAVDLLAVAGMAAAGLKFKNSALKVRGQLGPALQEALALAGLGKAMAAHARKDGLAVAARVKSLAERLKKRAETTRRIVMELKPSAHQTAASVQESVQEKQSQFAGTAALLTDMGRRLIRLRSATESAAQAAQRPRRPGA